jgi:hypothetical protein
MKYLASENVAVGIPWMKYLASENGAIGIRGTKYLAFPDDYFGVRPNAKFFILGYRLWHSSG